MDSVKFWDNMAHVYDKHAMKKYAQAYAETVTLTREYLKETNHVLDFACGTGLTTVQLARNVQSIHAVDISPGMIEIAQDKCKKQGISNVSFDCATLFDERLKPGVYDKVLAFNILFALPQQEKVFARIGELLKPGGMFISATDCLAESSLKYRIGIWVMARLGKVPYEKLYTRKSLKAAISAGGFDIIETHNLYETPPNLFIVARKK
jgi:2-polyprenyl-3-methyl-5-hydroxy-6-metoxy-1,4-benzoquinol methylase